MTSTMKYLLAVLLLACPCVLHCAAAQTASKYNVLFIAADDLRNDLGAFGNQQVKTPNFESVTLSRPFPNGAPTTYFSDVARSSVSS